MPQYSEFSHCVNASSQQSLDRINAKTLLTSQSLVQGDIEDSLFSATDASLASGEAGRVGLVTAMVIRRVAMTERSGTRFIAIWGFEMVG